METLLQNVSSVPAADLITKTEKTINTYLKTLTTEHGVHGRVLMWHPDENITKLRKKYWRGLSELHHLKHIISLKETAVKESCDHDWEYEADIDDRTHYTCKKCSKYR